VLKKVTTIQLGAFGFRENHYNTKFNKSQQGGENTNKSEFKAEVKKQLRLRRWNYGDLADRSGYTKRTIQQMMYDDTRMSKTAIDVIASVLGIEEEVS